MAHDFLKEMVEDETGRAGNMIVATLVGGVLLVTGFIAKVLFQQAFYSALLGILAAVLLGGPLVVNALRDLWRGRAQMNELVALGVVAAFATGNYLTAGAIAFFMILSTLVETRTALGARKSIESLIKLTPTKASRVQNGTESEVEAKDLRPGDVVRVRPGDNIPGDGRVITGASSVNQANITGESLPIDKREGDDVFGGTINLTGVLDVTITKSGMDTTLGRVQELVLQAERTKTPVMRLADRYAEWYTPLVLMIAAIVLFFTREMERAIAVILVACPSSIILSTPTVMVAALSAAARLGVLVKNVADFERARNLTAVVFDKTGTLTTGQLSVTRLGPATGADPAELLRVAAAVEQNSKHPVARAVMEIARKARVNPATVADFEEVAGRGVRATLDGQEALVGRATWLQENGVATETPDNPPADGLSLLYVTHAGRLLGWIGLEDRTRPQAARAMDDLREAGIKQLVMVTGDRWSVAKRVAAEMHCTDVQAEVLPAQKLEMVDGLKARGHVVAVVGDGVNDAPALAAGDLSIAMGAAGSDVAIHSASIALMNNNLNRIPFLVRLSRKAMLVIGQNIGLSIFFILIGGTLSALGWVSPLHAALLHALSSILVVFNAARLVREGEDLDTLPTEEPARKPTTAPVPVPQQGAPALA